jgi:hypothetical protein
MSDLRRSVRAAAAAGRILGVLIASGAICCATSASAFAHKHRRHHRHKAHVHRARTQRTNGPTAHGQLLHIVPNSLLQVTANANQSNNWFGYNQGSLEQGGKLFSSISGNWKIPRATQHVKGQDEYSSDWIGIGGGCVDANCAVGDGTLIQTGTEQDVAANGKSSYSAWWEVIPAPSLTITSMKVRPGDRMHASIAQAAPEVWTITIKDLTRNESYSTTVPYSSSMDTAEWIEETPLVLGTGPGFAPLPNLTRTPFDLATTNGQPANLKSSEEMQLVDSGGNVIGAPSAPDPDSDGFNACAWASSCPAPSTS